MNCNESISEYESKMNALTEAYCADLKKCVQEADAAKNTLADIDQSIKKLTKLCKAELSKKYANMAIEELSDYLNWFSVQVDSQPYGGDEAYVSVVEKIKTLNQLKEKTVQLIADINNAKASIEKEYRDATSVLTKKTREMYASYARTITAELNLKEPISDQGGVLPQEICIGNVLKPSSGFLMNLSRENFLRYPLTMDLHKGKGLLLDIGAYHNDEKNDRIFTALILRYLVAFPAGTAQVGIVDYVINQKMEQILNAFSGSVVSLADKVVDNPRSKDQLLFKVLDTAQEVSSLLSHNYCADLHALYEKKIRGNPFQLVFLKDVLRGTNEEGIKIVLNLIETYSRCGVRIVWMDDFSDTNMEYLSVQFKEIVKRIKDACTVLALTQNGYVYEEKRVELLSLPSTCTNADIYTYCLQYRGILNATRVSTVSYEDIGFGSKREDAQEAGETISIPIAWNAPHAWNIKFNCQNQDPLANLIVGIPGTGKSHLIDAIILNGAWKYSPDELVFHLLDFKDGLASSAYLNVCQIPHVKVVSRRNKAEEATIILSGIMEEKENRAEQFQRLNVANIAAFNRKTAQKMPRLIVVIDECQHLFDDEKMAEMSEVIAREGRAVGIHLVLATQTVTPKMMKTIKFVNGRYCFAVASEDELENLLGKEHKSRLKEISKETHQIFATDWEENGKVKKIIPAFDGDKGDDYLHRGEYALKIREKWNNYPIDVFDVSNLEPVYVENTEFQELCKRSERLCIPIGVNYQNRSNVWIKLEDKKQNAVLMIGTNEKISNGVISSILAKSSVDRTKVLYVGQAEDRTVKTELEHLYTEGLAHSYPCEKYLSALKELYELYSKRRKNAGEKYSPLLVVFDGMQNMLDFVNNTKYDNTSLTGTMTISVPFEGERMSYRERQQLRHQEAGGTEQRANVSVFGKDTFMELLGSAYTVNIFVCAVFDSINLMGPGGMALFSSTNRTTLGACNYKLFFPHFDVDEVMQIMDTTNTSSKKSVLTGLAENMCYLSVKTQRGKSEYKIKAFDFSHITDEMICDDDCKGEKNEDQSGL